jgi:hypothetical protein
MNQTINRPARSMLKESMLPRQYYSEAQAMATYIWNRKVTPRITKFVEFGAIGYAFITPELRSRLDDTRRRCRVLGYGDDDDTEEMDGFKVLFEDDLSIGYSNDVKFLG